MKTLSYAGLPSALSRLFLTLAAFACATAPLSAAKVAKNAFPNRSIFGIQAAGTESEFFGRADHVLSVSFQEYSTGPQFVSEVTIDMTGSNQLLRIYCARPISAQDAERSAAQASAAASDLTNGAIAPSVPSTPSGVTSLDERVQRAAARVSGGLVLKPYPTVTHAKTVEISVGSREELRSFYMSFRRLYIGIPVSVGNNNTVLPPPAAGATSAQPTATITQIGGTLFTIE